MESSATTTATHDRGGEWTPRRRVYAAVLVVLYVALFAAAIWDDVPLAAPIAAVAVEALMLPFRRTVVAFLTRGIAQGAFFGVAFESSYVIFDGEPFSIVSAVGGACFFGLAMIVFNLREQLRSG